MNILKKTHLLTLLHQLLDNQQDFVPYNTTEHGRPQGGGQEWELAPPPPPPHP